jgi:predicted PurR-regulated permease PerM
MTCDRAVSRMIRFPTFETPMDQPNGSRLQIATYVMTAAALFAILVLHLLPALLAGLLVYTLVNALAPPLQRHLPGARAHGLIVALLSIVVVGLLTLAIIGTVSFLRSEFGNPGQVFEAMMPLIDRARAQLPQIVVDHLPDSIDDFRTNAIDWLRTRRKISRWLKLLIAAITTAVFVKALYDFLQRYA